VTRDLQELEKIFRLFPGLGPVTAKRYAKVFLSLSDSDKNFCIDTMKKFVGNSARCEECGNFSLSGLCEICVDKSSRDCELLCVVENFDDIAIIEKSNSFNGLYVVTDGLFDFSKKKSSTHPDFGLLYERIRSEKVKEVLFSFKYSVEAQVTINYIIEKCKKEFDGVQFTILNFGIPAGIDISLMDSESIGESIQNRRNLSPQ